MTFGKTMCLRDDVWISTESQLFHETHPLYVLIARYYTYSICGNQSDFVVAWVLLGVMENVKSEVF